ncbi:MAG: PKD domain-containing protein [Bacteroidales bacterium]
MVNFTTGAATCASQAVQFIDQSSTPGGIPTISWMWDFGDPASGIYNTSTQQNPMHIFTGTGVYNVKLIVSNLNGCYDTVVKSVEISHLPVAQFTADSACLGTPTHFTDQSSTSTGTITNWLWDFGDGYTSTLQNPEHTYMNWGTYAVTLTVTNGSGCQNDASMSVLVKPLPVAAFSYSGECAGAPTYFTDMSVTPQGNIVQWLWDFGDGASSSIANPVHVYSTGGTFTVNLTVINGMGCSSSTPQTVHIFNPPTANFSYNSVFCPATQVRFQDLTVGNGTPESCKGLVILLR